MGVQVVGPDIARIWNSWKKNILLLFFPPDIHIAVNGGVIILSFFASAQILGLYGMAERIGMVLRIAPTLITQAAYPGLVSFISRNRKNFIIFLKKVNGSSLLLTLLISLTVFALAPFIIGLMAGNVWKNQFFF